MLLPTKVRALFQFPYLVSFSVPGPCLGCRIPLVVTSPLGCDGSSDVACVRRAQFFSKRSSVRTRAWAPGVFLSSFQWTESWKHACTCAHTRGYMHRTHALTRVPVCRRGSGLSPRRPCIPGPSGRLAAPRLPRREPRLPEHVCF